MGRSGLLDFLNNQRVFVIEVAIERVVGDNIIEGMPGDHIELLHDIRSEESEQVIAVEEENIGTGDNLRLRILFANHRDYLYD